MHVQTFSTSASTRCYYVGNTYPVVWDGERLVKLVPWRVNGRLLLVTPRKRNELEAEAVIAALCLEPDDYWGLAQPPDLRQ